MQALRADTQGSSSSSSGRAWGSSAQHHWGDGTTSSLGPQEHEGGGKRGDRERRAGGQQDKYLLCVAVKTARFSICVDGISRRRDHCGSAAASEGVRRRWHDKRPAARSRSMSRPRVPWDWPRDQHHVCCSGHEAKNSASCAASAAMRPIAAASRAMSLTFWMCRNISSDVQSGVESGWVKVAWSPSAKVSVSTQMPPQTPPTNFPACIQPSRS